MRPEDALQLAEPKGYLCAAGCGHDTAIHRVAGCDVLGCECTAPYGRILPPEDVPEPSAFLDKAVADDYEAQVEDLTQRLNVSAADLLETRSQRAHLARQLAVAAEQAIEHAKRHARLFDEWVRERAQLVDERDEARDEVVRLGRELELAKQNAKAVALYAEQRQAERDRERAENVRLRTITGEFGAAEAAEPPPDLEQVVDVSGSLRRSVAEQIGCPSCHTILNARAAGGCGDTWHWENRQPPEEQIEALRPDSSPKYGTCEQCGRVGYEVEASCHTCHITLCPFCEHDCDEVPT